MVLFFTAYPISGLAVASGSSAYQIPAPEDFSGLPWSEAFEKLHGKFSREYAFTDWKQINWPALYAKFKPQIDRAQASKDFTAYYLALKEYVHSIPDGHVRITAIRDIDYKYIGGGFGVGIHNTLEAATFGLPLAFGPNYEKFQEARDLIGLQ